MTTERRLRFAFITPCAGEAFFGPVKVGMNDAATLMAVDCAFGGTVDVDLQQQIALVKGAIAGGYDGIALSVIHPTAFNGVIGEARECGIPVIAFNVAAGHPANGCLSAVCQDVYEAGRTLGRQAAPALVERPVVLLTIHSEGISALDDRLRGIQEILAGKGIRWQLVATGTEPERAAQVIAAALRAHPQIRAVLCTGQADTEGAGLAIERAFPGQGFYAAGFDLSPEILRLVEVGVIAFTIDQQPYVQGFYPVVQLALYCRYGLGPADIDAGATIITRENAASVQRLSRAGYR
jgi:simple sugar transport system substrate-binding protein